MNKKLICAALAALMLTGLSACGETSQAPDTGSAATQVAEQTTTTVAAAPADGSETTAAADGNAEPASTDNAPAGTISYDYIYNGATIVVGEEADPIISALGTPDGEPFAAPSCAFTGESYYYNYGGEAVQVITYPDEHDQSLNRIYSVELRNDTVATNEGIMVGDTYDDVIAKYGTPTSESMAYVMYRDGSKAVQFFTEGNTVKSIVYTIMF